MEVDDEEGGTICLFHAIQISQRHSSDFVYRDGMCVLASLTYKKNSVFMTMGKVIKLPFLHLVVQLHTHNSLTVLAISTKLCEYIDFHMKMCIGILNVL